MVVGGGRAQWAGTGSLPVGRRRLVRTEMPACTPARPSTPTHADYMAHKTLFGWPNKLVIPNGGVVLFCFKKILRWYRVWSVREKAFSLYTCRSPRYGPEIGNLMMPFVVASAFALVSRARWTLACTRSNGLAVCGGADSCQTRWVCVACVAGVAAGAAGRRLFLCLWLARVEVPLALPQRPQVRGRCVKSAIAHNPVRAQRGARCNGRGASSNTCLMVPRRLQAATTSTLCLSGFWAAWPSWSASPPPCSPPRRPLPRWVAAVGRTLHVVGSRGRAQHARSALTAAAHADGARDTPREVYCACPQFYVVLFSMPFVIIYVGW